MNNSSARGLSAAVVADLIRSCAGPTTPSATVCTTSFPSLCPASATVVCRATKTTIMSRLSSKMRKNRANQSNKCRLNTERGSERASPRFPRLLMIVFCCVLSLWTTGERLSVATMWSPRRILSTNFPARPVNKRNRCERLFSMPRNEMCLRSSEPHLKCFPLSSENKPGFKSLTITSDSNTCLRNYCASAVR